MTDPKTTDYCAVCGESPDSGSHLPQGHAHVPPIYPMELVDRVRLLLLSTPNIPEDEHAIAVIAEVRRLPAPTTRFGDRDSCAQLGEASRENEERRALPWLRPVTVVLRQAALVYAADELERFGAPASAQLAREIAAALTKE